MTNNKSQKSLLEAIARMALFSYEPAIKKHPFLLKYLQSAKDPKMDWVLLMTAAGAGYVLLTKEDYPGEHDEMAKSVQSTDGLPGIVAKFMEFMSGLYQKDERFYHLGIGAWMVRQIKGEEFSDVGKEEAIKQVDEVNVSVGRLLTLTIDDYVKSRIKKT